MCVSVCVCVCICAGPPTKNRGVFRVGWLVACLPGLSPPPTRPGNNMITWKFDKNSREYAPGTSFRPTFATFGNPPQTSPGYAPEEDSTGVHGCVILMRLDRCARVCHPDEKSPDQTTRCSRLAPGGFHQAERVCGGHG